MYGLYCMESDCAGFADISSCWPKGLDGDPSLLTQVQEIRGTSIELNPRSVA